MMDTTKTDRFMAEHSTTMEIFRYAFHNGFLLTFAEAHLAWAEHSDDYCAGWLDWRDSDHTAEIKQALTAYQERHGKLKTYPKDEQ